MRARHVLALDQRLAVSRRRRLIAAPPSGAATAGGQRRHFLQESGGTHLYEERLGLRGPWLRALPLCEHEPDDRSVGPGGHRVEVREGVLQASLSEKPVHLLPGRNTVQGGCHVDAR
jgi:hypothetical protein